MHERAAQRATAKLEREREASREKMARVRAELDATRREAAVQEHAAKRATAKLEREREASTEKMARVRAERDELRSSYHLSGAGKKLDLQELEGFSEIARAIMADGRTGMIYDRLYTLWQAVRAAPPGKPVIELGAYRGGSARFIAETLQAVGRTPPFYACDTFVGPPQTDPAIDVFHRETDKFETVSAEATAQYLSGYPDLRLIAGDIAQTSAQLSHESFGFVHVDVNVYPATAHCLRFFAPRLADHALMVIDDYGFVTCPGVKRAADEFVAEFPQFRLWHLLTGQAILWRIGPNP